MTVEEKIYEMGLEDEDILIFKNPDYEDAFLGVTNTNIAVYDYNLMVESLMDAECMDELEAVEFIDYNTLNAYFGEGTPVVLYRYDRDFCK